MKNILWLTRRELWEHKVEFVLAPIAVSALFVGLIFFWAVGQNFFGFTASIVVNDMKLSAGEMSDPTKLEGLRSILIAGAFIVIGIQLTLTALIQFSYAANCMSSEKRDRSVLFWKSMPLSDVQTVVSKMLTASLLIQVISIGVLLTAIPIGTCVLLWGLGGISGEFVRSGQLLDFFLIVFRTMLAYLPLQILWALPTVGWCMFVSSLTRNNSSLMAFGLPAILLGILVAFGAMFGVEDSSAFRDWLFGFDVNRVGYVILMRMIFGTIPLSWGYFSDDLGSGLSGFLDYGWNSTYPIEILGGLIGGSLFVYGAMLIRKRSSGD